MQTKTTTTTAPVIKPTIPVLGNNTQSTAVQNIPAKNEQSNIEVMKLKVKTLHEKFENAKTFNSKKAFYDEFNERLENVKEFRQRHDGSGLTLSIKNQSTGKIVDFSNQNLIISFLDEAIQQGEHIKDKCEIEMMSLEV